jgi:hypothetical protein
VPRGPTGEKRPADVIGAIAAHRSQGARMPCCHGGAPRFVDRRRHV